MKEFVAIVFGGIVTLITILLTTFAFLASLTYLKANGLEKLGYTTKVVAGDCYAKVDNKWITCNKATSNTTNVNINVKEVK